MSTAASSLGDASAYRYSSAEEIHMHDLLLPAIRASIRQHQPRRVLDIGCGNAYLTEQLRLAHPDATFCGIEPSDGGVAHAAAFPHIQVRHGSVYDGPPADWTASFDMVIATEVVEHLYTPRALPEYMQQVLKPGGIAVVTTPYHGYLKNLALSVVNKWDFHLNPFWDNGHIKFWSRKTLRLLFEQEGFDFIRFQGIGRVPYLWMTMLMEFKRWK